MLWAMVGLASSGKSTLFKLMTNKGSSGKSGKGLDIAVAHVPDPRVSVLVDIFDPKKISPAEIEFADTLGAVGSGGAVFSELQSAGAMIYCLRAFDSVFGDPTPIKDFRDLMGELVLFDLNILEHKMESIEKSLRTAKPEVKIRIENEMKIIEVLRAHLESGGLIRDLELDPIRAEIVSNFGLLTAKPAVAVFTCGEDYYCNRDRLINELDSAFSGLPSLAIMTLTELELNELDHESAEIFREEYNLTEPVIDRFIMKAYDAAGIITFFTCGEKEVHAWPIRKGSNALEAAGKIHTDLAKGFIRAEVVSYEDILKYHGWAQARNAGHLRVEGKEYIVEDGDTIVIKFAL
ncbi:DUF933 domain-containing protein [bacterium]|nr:DUF933 domain-containing protein [bacterium]